MAGKSLVYRLSGRRQAVPRTGGMLPGRSRAMRADACGTWYERLAVGGRPPGHAPPNGGDRIGGARVSRAARLVGVA